jgi:hypothetical protein
MRMGLQVFLLEMQVSSAGARVASRSKVPALASNVPMAIQEQLKASLASVAAAAPPKPVVEDPLAGLF